MVQVKSGIASWGFKTSLLFILSYYHKRIGFTIFKFQQIILGQFETFVGYFDKILITLWMKIHNF